MQVRLLLLLVCGGLDCHLAPLFTENQIESAETGCKLQTIENIMN